MLRCSHSAEIQIAAERKPLSAQEVFFALCVIHVCTFTEYLLISDVTGLLAEETQCW